MADGPVHVSRPLADVLERIGISLDDLAAQGYPLIAASLRRALDEEARNPVTGRLQPGPNDADPYEPPRLRVIR